MNTRSRDYAANPRSPPKRKRRNQRKTNTLPEISTNSENPHTSSPYFSYNLSALPPLPPSLLNFNLTELPNLPDSPSLTPTQSPPCEELSFQTMSLKSKTSPIDPASPDLTTLHHLPESTTPKSELVETLSKLQLRDTALVSTYSVDRTTKPYPTLSERFFTSDQKIFERNPKIFPKRYFIHNVYNKMSESKSTDSPTTTTTKPAATLTTQDITEAKENLGN
ncbi:uncharacterized protein MELLADRAFT_108698 [Melampsora larici-populina 98AG31]|uniref:Uncharacterized protein n=1 Tax=Melampsora larici-populina (strain 98AG31 / pathotype 3-4-7) TaxID=747676 RepID=F4RTY4_MELLP|nr:uncharacterized protein MELLADRAFT_108698 [Melampsora larici-populina 98AG31]EGG04085.1 hypothetical protein MELLADRAFT_108698 [Melampsora larici-populina 98AG31]